MKQAKTSVGGHQRSRSDKWIKGVSPDEPVSKAAAQILRARFEAVRQALSLAVERSGEDVEHVHQLRIATRRAVEALRLFADLLPKKLYAEFRWALRRIRRAADEARNWDVLSEMFLRDAPRSAKGVLAVLAGDIRNRRRTAQQPIMDVHKLLAAGKFDRQIARMLKGLSSRQVRGAKQSFKRRARRGFGAAAKRFIKAAGADLSDDENLHQLRICSKKVRYTMELVAVAFAPSFRKRLYPKISRFQDLVGLVNDHAMGTRFFRDWAARTRNVAVRTLLEGVALAETRAHRDLRSAFLLMWRDRSFHKLRARLKSYLA